MCVYPTYNFSPVTQKHFFFALNKSIHGFFHGLASLLCLYVNPHFALTKIMKLHMHKKKK